MKTLRTLVLLCGTAITVMALAAPPAMASSPVELRQPCSPCVISAIGESHVNLFGIRVSTCADLLSLELYANGTGHASYTNANHNTGTCTRRACNGVGEAAGEAEFVVHSIEETATGESTMSYRQCLDTASNPNATGTHCTVPIDVTKPSSYQFEVHATCAGGIIEFEAEWYVTGGDAFEIAHL